MIPELGQEKYKMSLEHLDVPESKEILKGWGCVKKMGAILKGLLLAKSRTI